MQLLWDNCKEVGLNPKKLDIGNLQMVKSFFSDMDLIFDSYHKLNTAEKRAIEQIQLSPEWKSMIKYYKAIVLSLYKDNFNNGNVKSARELIVFMIAIKNRPKKFLTQKSYGSNEEQRNEHEINSGGYYTGSFKGSGDVSDEYDKHGEII